MSFPDRKTVHPPVEVSDPPRREPVSEISISGGGRKKVKKKKCLRSLLFFLFGVGASFPTSILELYSPKKEGKRTRRPQRSLPPKNKFWKRRKKKIPCQTTVRLLAEEEFSFPQLRLRTGVLLLLEEEGIVGWTQRRDILSAVKDSLQLFRNEGTVVTSGGPRRIRFFQGTTVVHKGEKKVRTTLERDDKMVWRRTE